MVKIKLPFLAEDVDRHGNARIYVRRPGHPKIRIRGTPGSAEFMAAYHQALAGIAQQDQRAKVERIEHGSLETLCRAYYASSEFKTLDGSTQSWRRRALDKVCLKYGKGPVAQLEARHIRAMREEIASTPAAANHRLKALKALFVWAIEAGEVKRNPARDVKLIRYKTNGHHTWTLEEVERFEARHPIGTKPRLAMALMLYTTCRREDVTRLGAAHVRAGRIKFIQGKNEHRSPVEVDMPVHPDLAEVLALATDNSPTFLVTAYGKPFSVAGFGNWFRERCDEAALPHCSAHGLRKATAARLAERGATAKEIMAITGHQSLEEVEVYTRQADNAKLADAGMRKLTSRKRVSHLSGSADGSGTNSGET